MKRLLALALFCLMITQLASANERGNGGDALVCRNPNGGINDVYLFDYYEGKYARGFVPLEHKESNTDYIKKLSAVLVKFDQSTFADFEKEALKLEAAIKTFLAGRPQSSREVVFTVEDLVDIPDTGNTLLKPGCGVEQLAIRVKKTFADDPSYLINSYLLSRMSKQDVLGLILHEAIYRAFVIHLGAEDSVAARYFHQKLTAKPIDQLHFRDYVEVARFIKPKGLEFNRGSRSFTADEADYLEDGSVRMGDLSYDSDLVVVLDQKGELDLQKTRQFGGIRARMFTRMNAWGQFESVMTTKVNGKEILRDTRPNGEVTGSGLLPFGKWEVILSLKNMYYPMPMLTFGLAFKTLEPSGNLREIMRNANDGDQSSRDLYSQSGETRLTENFEFVIENVRMY